MMFSKILSALAFRRSDQHTQFIRRLSALYDQAPADFGGGCAYRKALVLAFLIKEFNLRVTVDIGVYRGRSLFPQAIAHKEFTKGIVYGVDPYDNEAAIQNDREDIRQQLHEFANNTDFNKIFEDVKALTKKFNLQEQTIFLRRRSSEAVEHFYEKGIALELVHIDGNHDTNFVMQDVREYLPLISENGFIVLDDISWLSVRPAYEFLNEKILLVGEFKDSQNDFAVFTKSSDEKQTVISRNLMKTILNCTL